MSAPARCSETHTAAYQISGTTSRGRTIASPALQPNAFANASEFDSGPFARHSSGACGSAVTRVIAALVALVRAPALRVGDEEALLRREAVDRPGPAVARERALQRVVAP